MVIPLEVYLTYRDLIKALWTLIRWRFKRPFKVPNQALFMGWDISSILRKHLTSGGWRISLQQYLHFALGDCLSKKYCISACALTFEGNPWERMFIAGLRKNLPDLLIVGYQHAVVSHAGAGVFVGKHEKKNSPLPSIILTTGEIPKEIISKYGHFSHNQIYSSCAFRYEYLYQQAQNEKPLYVKGKRFTVLVALEFTWDILALVEYVISQAPRCLNSRFVFRAHPALPIDILLSRLDRKLETENIKVSEGNSLSQDILQTDAVMYCGSTVSLEALMIGKPVIHFDTGDLPSCDPLFGFDQLKWTVSQHDELCLIIEVIKGLSEDCMNRLKLKARTYIQSYFHLVNDQSMYKFMPTDCFKKVN